VSGDMHGTGTLCLLTFLRCWLRLEIVNMTVHSSDDSYQSVEVEVLNGTSQKVIATGSGTSDQPFTFDVKNPNLWSPDTPALYNISVKMGSDNVTTYTGFRSLGKGSVNNITRPLLNGEFIFAFGTLEYTTAPV